MVMVHVLLPSTLQKQITGTSFGGGGGSWAAILSHNSAGSGVAMADPEEAQLEEAQKKNDRSGRGAVGRGAEKKMAMADPEEAQKKNELWSMFYHDVISFLEIDPEFFHKATLSFVVPVHDANATA